MLTTSNANLLRRLAIATAFSIAFAYIESAVVVYLRVIFYPNGFMFPIATFDVTMLGKRLMITEIGREAATLVLIATSAWLFGRNRQQRAGYFLLIFAVWDIFYYVWLKILIDWPASILDWDVLFLIPTVWASAVLYPLLVAVAILALAVLILLFSARRRRLNVTWIDWMGWTVAGVIVVTSFCLGGRYITEPAYRSGFHPSLFLLGYVMGIVASVCALTRRPRRR